MTMRSLGVLALLLSSLTCACADEPSLQAVLSQKGLQKVSRWVRERLERSPVGVKVPDVKGSVNIYIGTVEYQLHHMSVVRCQLPEPSVTLLEGVGVSFGVSRLAVAIKGSWNTHFGLIYDGGWFELVVALANLSAVVQVGRDGRHLSFSALSCSASVEAVEITFHGGASFIINEFVSWFRQHILTEIREKICPAFTEGIRKLNLAAMSDSLWVDQYVYMNVSLTDAPVLKNDGFKLFLKGEFYSGRFPSEPPFPVVSFDLPRRGPYMLSVGVSEFLVNSAAFSYLSAGVLITTITDDMIPKSSPIHLNTSQFGFFIPQLPKLYPDMSMMIVLYARDTPLVSFAEALIGARLFAAAKFLAVKNDSALIPLFKLHLDVSFGAKVYTRKQLLMGSVEMRNLTVELESTEIGDFPIPPINNVVKMILSTLILPKINGRLNDGFPLPSVKGFSIQDSVLTVENGFLVVEADVGGPSDMQ